MRRLIAWAVVVVCVSVTRSAEPAASARALVVLEKDTEEGRPVLVATVTRDAQPVAGATVAIFARRTFGLVALGRDETLEDGTAAVPFPEDLPADTSGGWVFVAEVLGPAELAGTRCELALVAPAAPAPDPDPFPRALWSPRAPVPLLTAIVVLLGGVWVTYLYVVGQLLRIRQGGGA